MILTAFIALGSLLMVALVVDLGQLRVDRRTNKGVADVAARAGISRLAFGPWSGVCKAREFLLGNAKGFSSFDAGSETWSNAAALVYGANPCTAVASAPDVNPCRPNLPSTWAKLQATALSGRFTIEIQSGYVLPDPRFPTDATLGDTGVTDRGSCDNLAVIISERQPPSFAQVGGAGPMLVRTRSVGRLNSMETLDFVAALQLLELYDCGVLQTSGSGTRVIAQPFGEYPGTFQIDSDASGHCPGPIIDGQATTGGPTAVACSVVSTNADCNPQAPGSGSRPSRVGVYAKNFNKPDSVIATPYPSTYGDTAAVASPRTGRKYVDLRYRESVVDLDEKAQVVLTGNGNRPPGCSSVTANACAGTDGTWVVLQQAQCNDLASFTLTNPLWTTARNIYFNCDLTVSTSLILPASDAYVVITGKLAVNSIFTITDPRKVYVGGQTSGNRVGIDVGNGGILSVNMGGAPSCSLRSGPGHANRFVLGNGKFKAGSGASVRLCQTFTYLASGYDKVPNSDGDPPCDSPCGTYSGTLEVTSGASVDLSAPNEITGRLPDPAELATTNPFEDIGLWTEAGGGANGLTGGALTSLAGVFFLPNAAPFTLAGGGVLPIALSAQFVSTTLKVTGNGKVDLVPNPEDSIPVRIYTNLLVR